MVYIEPHCLTRTTFLFPFIGAPACPPGTLAAASVAAALMPALTVSTSIFAGNAGEYGDIRLARGGSGSGGRANRPFDLRSAADTGVLAVVGSEAGAGAGAGLPAVCFPLALDLGVGAGRASTVDLEGEV